METTVSSEVGDGNTPPGARVTAAGEGDGSTTKDRSYFGYPDAASYFEAKREEHFSKYVTLVSHRLEPVVEKDSVAKFQVLCSGWANYMGRREFIYPNILISMICRNAVRCARVALQGGDLLNGHRADPNGRHRYGFSPLHVAAEMFNVDMVKLLLRYGASANVRTEGDRVIEGLFPLHVAVENASMHKFLEDHWEDGRPLDNLVSLLCLPEMKMFLDTTRLIAKHTDNLIDEVCNYINDDGKLAQLAILLLAAQKQLRGPKHRSRSKVSRDGFDIIRARTLDSICSLHLQTIAMVNEGKKGSALKKLKNKKEALITASTLVWIIDNAGDALERYIQTHSEVPHEEILEKVSSILNSNGIVSSGKGIDTGNVKGYRYFWETMIQKSDSQVDSGPGEPNAVGNSSSLNAEGSKKIWRKVVPKGLAINDARNKFFPYWKSVLSARLKVHVIPSCEELSIKDRKAIQCDELSRRGVQVGNKSRGMSSLPRFGSQFERTRQLCTVALTSLKMIRRS